MELSALHREQGLLPSHLDFFRRQRSQALHTRFRRLSEESCDFVLRGADIVDCGGVGEGSLVNRIRADHKAKGVVASMNGCFESRAYEKRDKRVEIADTKL